VNRAHDITAVILAGGLGTRLRPVVSDRPKVLAEVNGRPFITYIFDRLISLGIRKAVICTGYMADRVEAIGNRWHGAFDSVQPPETEAPAGELELSWSREEVPMGTGGAFRLGLQYVDTPWILGLNGDSVCTANLAAFMRAARTASGPGSLLLTEVRDTSHYGSVTLNDRGIITGFLEKGGLSAPGWVNAGVYLLSRELVAEIPDNQPVSIERDSFPAWIPKGLRGFPMEGELLDIGTPESYSMASRFLAPGRRIPDIRTTE
jgi:NDP-sugar pyrophosphorylase family protein